MKSLRESYLRGEGLHHAYLLAGSISESKRSVLQFLKNAVGIITEGNPDVLSLHYQSLGVDSSRDLKEQTRRKPLSGSQYIIVSFSFATTEAENALLKLFEEPHKGTHFFILTPSVGTLSPTLRSRLIPLQVEKSRDEDIASVFLKSTKGDRVLLLKNTIENKNKEELLALITSIESQLHGRLSLPLKANETARAADSLMHARTYLESNSASVKIIGEYLAAVIPR